MLAGDELADVQSDTPKNIREYALVRHFQLRFADMPREIV